MIDDPEGSLARRIDRVSLRFRDADVESRYLVVYLSRSLPVIRKALLLGALLFVAFGVLDYILVEDRVAELWAIRYLIVCPVLLGAYVLTYTPLIWSFSQLILSVAMAVAGLSIIAMTAILDMPAAHLYYAGLILVIIYCATLFRLHFIRGAAISIGLFAAYLITAAFINPIPSWALVSNVFFLSVAVGVGVFASYAIDVFMRSLFVQNETVEQARRTAEALRIKAEEASHAKSQFLATMSHELRTPLNAIIGFSEVMKGEILGPIGNEKYKEYAQDIYRSGRFLRDIIDDILDLSKAEAGVLRLEEGEVDLIRLIQDVIALFRGQATERDIKVVFQVPSRPAHLLGDERLVQQLLVNLITNSLKFTNAKGRIVVSLWEEPSGHYTLSVADTGRGIAESERARVFEPFVQLDDAFTCAQGGAGLGLPMVQKIAELHGAKILLDTEVGQGTEFRIVFPPERRCDPNAADAKYGGRAS